MYGFEIAGIGLEVRDAAQVVQQVAKGDVLAVRDEAGEPALDAVGEMERAFGDQLEHDRRGVGLGEARELEVVARAPSASCVRRRRDRRSAAACGGRRGRAGSRPDARGDQRVDVLLECRGPDVRSGFRRGRRARRRERARDTGEECGRGRPCGRASDGCSRRSSRLHFGSVSRRRLLVWRLARYPLGRIGEIAASIAYIGDRHPPVMRRSSWRARIPDMRVLVVEDEWDGGLLQRGLARRASPPTSPATARTRSGWRGARLRRGRARRDAARPRRLETCRRAARARASGRRC